MRDVIVLLVVGIAVLSARAAAAQAQTAQQPQSSDQKTARGAECCQRKN